MREATLVETTDQLYDFLTWYRGLNGVPLSVDTETEGLEHWHHRLRLTTCSDGDVAWAIPTELWAGVHRDMESYGGEIRMFNGQFDMKYLGWKRPYEDAMIAAHVIDPRPPHGLKFLGKRHVSPDGDAYQKQLDVDMKRHRWDWMSVPLSWPAYWRYACYDAWLTHHLSEVVLPQVKGHPIYDLELATAHVIREVERRGMRTDQAYVRRACDHLEVEIAARYQEGLDAYGCELGSVQQVARAMLREEVPIPPWARTPKGAVSLTEEVLEAIGDAHPLPRLVREYRGLVKAKSTWLEPFLELADADGFVYPSIRPLGARTGRMSITNPAMQTLPRGELVRNAVVPREGRTLMLVDYAQAELRVLAHLADDEAMIAAIVNQEDLHQMLADVAGCSRQSAKTAWFGRVYGAGDEQFAKLCGVSVEEGREIKAAMNRRFPGIQMFLKNVERLARNRYDTEGVAYVTSPYGRRHIGDRFQEYRLANYLVQGTATADLLKTKICELDASGWAEYLVTCVHDELIFDVPNDLLASAQIEVPAIMEDLTTFKVPMNVETTTYSRWGEKYAGKDDKFFRPAIRAGRYWDAEATLGPSPR